MDMLWCQGAQNIGLSNHKLNPLEPGVIMWLHFECSAPCTSNLPFLISDTRALWPSRVSARVPECQKLTRGSAIAEEPRDALRQLK